MLLQDFLLQYNHLLDVVSPWLSSLLLQYSCISKVKTTYSLIEIFLNQEPVQSWRRTLRFTLLWLFFLLFFLLFILFFIHYLDFKLIVFTLFSHYLIKTRVLSINKDFLVLLSFDRTGNLRLFFFLFFHLKIS